mmetsp:Transcript_9588/g.18005  ORF Transcript_9588/g.18005 Transcript_9588/m.18005 type:complete len:222 (+) Transcript_9588:48-713(+)
MNDYQKKRLENIKRNNARLRSLGLISTLEERRSNALAGCVECSNGENDDEKSALKTTTSSSASGKKKKRKNVQVDTQMDAPTRRKSLRLQGIGAEGVTITTVAATTDANTDVIAAEREARIQECRQVRLRAAKAFAECHGAEKAAEENPTASYEHCLMRVRSMSEKGLLNRVKAIERAAGKHCVVKMAIFKSCLQDEGLWDLAEQASEALERLKALQPIPS